MSKNLRIAELDFDEIKTNLKEFLQDQDEFTDYDFEGSGLSILLDILAYNTHYNAYYLNMVANEAFLDTALLRESVVSHAKSLGYVPHSQRSPVAIINFTAKSANNDRSTLIIPAGYSFLSNQIDNTTYNFIVLEDISVTKANSEYFFENLKIYEGQFLTYNFVHDDSTNPKQIFTLPDENIDTTTIKVAVSPSVSNTDITIYSKVTDVLDVIKTSEVFFLQESRDGKFQIYFGNDVVGKKIPDGAVVTVNYIVTDATAANKANNFIATSPLVDFLSESITDFTITPISAAAGGADRESVDRIKFSATARFSTQNRLVTLKDYETYILNNYPSVDSISVWGGEDEVPEVYGKVFVSLKPKENFFISESEKQRIIDEIIKPKSIISVDVEIRDPEFLYILLTNTVSYDPKKLTVSETTLQSQIRSAILGYKTTNLDKFDSVFSISKLQDTIDNVDLKSIVGTETFVRLQKRFIPTLGVATNYNIDFNTALARGTLIDKLSSSPFVVVDASGTERTAFIEEVPQSFTGISSIEITNAGYGYSSAPTVTISGDGVGATAEAIVEQGRVVSIVVTNRGFDYSRATVTISGGGGFSAVGNPVIDSSIGTIRTIYFDANANRQIIRKNAGQINYNTGRIFLDNLRVISIPDGTGLIRLTVGSEEGIIQSSRSVIVTIDETDTASITTELVKSLI